MELEFDNFISRHCGQTSQPWTIISNYNIVTVKFRSDDFDSGLPGFLAVWSATIEPPTYPPTLTGCGECNFPFVFNDRIFDTCTSIDGDQPWCQADLAAPINEGTHLINANVRSYCPDTDSSCPSTPQMSTHTNNQPGNCSKFY